MKQSRTKLAQVVADRSLTSTNKQALSQEIAAYLLAEGRVDELDSMLRDVQADWARDGYVEVLAYSAYPLSTNVKAEVVNQVKALYPDAKQISITEIEDPEVIGGVRLRLPNQQLDLSIEAKFNRFKQLTLAGKK